MKKQMIKKFTQISLFSQADLDSVTKSNYHCQFGSVSLPEKIQPTQKLPFEGYPSSLSAYQKKSRTSLDILISDGCGRSPEKGGSDTLQQ